jgi:RNA polymerase sigma factor (sigma-70 family)
MQTLAPQPISADPAISLTRVVRAHRAWVEAMARRHLGDPALAEEVTQDVFLRLAGLVQRPVEPAALRAWLLRTVWFLSANARRKAAKRRSVEACLASEFEGVADNSPPETLPLEELAAALDSLPELERALVLEHYFEGREHSEIGTRHHLSREAARKRIARSLTHLRSHLTRRGVALPSISLATVFGFTTNSSKAASTGTTIASHLASWLTRSPLKIASLTAAACVTVAVPVVLHQQRQLRELQLANTTANARADAAEAAATTRPALLTGSGWETAAWAPQPVNTAGFPNVPRLSQLQSILDSLPSLLAAARAEAPAPGPAMNLRLKFIVSETVTSLIQRQNEQYSLSQTRQTSVTGHLLQSPAATPFDAFPNTGSALPPLLTGDDAGFPTD